MFDPKILEQVAKQIHSAMPKPVKDLGHDVEQKVREVIQAQLTKLDIISREEFDIQTQVLLRTRQKLTEMEQKLAELEKQLAPKSAEVEAKPEAKPEKKKDCKKDDAQKEDGATSDKGEGAETAFTIDNFKIIQQALITLGIPQDELEAQIKEGKKLVEVLETADIPIKKFKKQLYKEYTKAIKEGTKEGKLTKEEAKTLKKAIKEKVDSWMSETN